jgi:hypothetical protein
VAGHFEGEVRVGLVQAAFDGRGEQLADGRVLVPGAGLLDDDPEHGCSHVGQPLRRPGVDLAGALAVVQVLFDLLGQQADRHAGRGGAVVEGAAGE